MEKTFRAVSLRISLLQQVKDWIEKHPTYITENPEYNSVAGFVDKATRLRLQQLKNSKEA